jgi:hypothetical protein
LNQVIVAEASYLIEQSQARAKVRTCESEKVSQYNLRYSNLLEIAKTIY